MIKKNERVTHTEFSQYFSQGARHHTPYFTIITHPHPNQKIAVVVGKKVAASAVQRNQLRRRLYAALQKELATSRYQGVCLVLAKPPVAELSSATTRSQLHTAIAVALKNT
jgi:ribonuclease P protein component